MPEENKKLLVECMTFECDPNVLTESISSKDKTFIVKGILQRANSKNQNGRQYPREILLRESQKYTESLIKERRALGELDHPESSVINLKNVSHNVVEMHWENDDLVGTVEILTTPSGNILRELFRSGIRLGISSRGLGSVKKISESGGAVVGDDFELICFDFVSNPSTYGAFMFPETSVMKEGVSPSIIVEPKWKSTEEVIREILSEIK